MNASSEEIIQAIKFSAQSEFAKATRRIIYNFSEQNLDESGYFHVDVMSGIGSGLVVYQNFRFFLLTAKHNLKQLYPPELRNDSPIWVPVNHPPKWNELWDFFMARRIWHIGELIDYESETIDATDIVLIEFFPPPTPLGLPDQFVSICGSDYFLYKEDFFEKQILMCSGFPAKFNFYQELDSNSEYTQSTIFNLANKFGMFITDDKDGFVSFTGDMDITHEDLNGMSGGPVYSVYHNDSEIKLAGIILTGGGNKLRFLPAYVFHEAIISYRDARCEVVDPVSNLTDHTERPDKVLKLFCDMVNKDENYRRRLGLLSDT